MSSLLKQLSRHRYAGVSKSTLDIMAPCLRDQVKFRIIPEIIEKKSSIQEIQNKISNDEPRFYYESAHFIRLIFGDGIDINAKIDPRRPLIFEPIAKKLKICILLYKQNGEELERINSEPLMTVSIGYSSSLENFSYVTHREEVEFDRTNDKNLLENYPFFFRPGLNDANVDALLLKLIDKFKEKLIANHSQIPFYVKDQINQCICMNSELYGLSETLVSFDECSHGRMELIKASCGKYHCKLCIKETNNGGCPCGRALADDLEKFIFSDNLE